MTPSQLKAHVEQTRSSSKFFCRENMRFAGDRMSNYGVRETAIDTWTEEDVPVYELYRRKPVKGGLQSSAYFRKDTFEQTFPKR